MPVLLSTRSLAPSAAAAVDSPDPAETKSALEVFADVAIDNIDLGWWASLVLVLLADIRSWRDSGCFAARAGWSGGRRLACSGGRR